MSSNTTMMYGKPEGALADGTAPHILTVTDEKTGLCLELPARPSEYQKAQSDQRQALRILLQRMHEFSHMLVDALATFSVEGDEPNTLMAHSHAALSALGELWVMVFSPDGLHADWFTDADDGGGGGDFHNSVTFPFVAGAFLRTLHRLSLINETCVSPFIDQANATWSALLEELLASTDIVLHTSAQPKSLPDATCMVISLHR